MEDGGQYECQATTHPPQSIFVNLRVVGEWRPFFEARTEINSVSEYICNTINLSVQKLSSVLTQIVGLNELINKLQTCPFTNTAESSDKNDKP